MNTHQSSTEHISKILNDEFKLMHDLKQLLELEQAILIENEADKLATTLQEKNKLIAEINQLEKQRTHHLNQLGHSNDAEGMQTFLAQQNATNLPQTWQELMGVSSQAQELNRNNGMLISRQLNRNQQALSILQKNDPHSSTYGADGQTKLGTNTARGFSVG
jgi:flagellar biosynthesis/type III secretory pathway chaperone